LAVGGIKEKILAAKRAGIKNVILPAANQGDFKELPQPVRAGVNVHFVERFSDLVPLVF
jgi:ATP-dependent Lon protease